jgi:tRNA A37 threonylcarbamoyladenosine modification protein TsaB
LDAIATQIKEDDFIITVDARRKEVYWARYKNGVRVGQPAVHFPAHVTGAPIHADLFPDMVSLVNLPGNITEPIYLRRPDAVATADR